MHRRLSLLSLPLVLLPFTHAESLSCILRPVPLTVDLTTRFQEIDGFGFSESFQRAYNIYNLPEPARSNLVGLLFNTTTGAGFSSSVMASDVVPIARLIG
jgi:hypothetical protein